MDLNDKSFKTHMGNSGPSVIQWILLIVIVSHEMDLTESQFKSNWEIVDLTVSHSVIITESQ